MDTGEIGIIHCHYIPLHLIVIKRNLPRQVILVFKDLGGGTGYEIRQLCISCKEYLPKITYSLSVLGNHIQLGG
jgi:hypothetical protein